MQVCSCVASTAKTAVSTVMAVLCCRGRGGGTDGGPGSRQRYAGSKAAYSSGMDKYNESDEEEVGMISAQNKLSYDDDDEEE